MTPGPDSVTFHARKGAATVMVREVPHLPDGHPELAERDMRRFVMDMASSRMARGNVGNREIRAFLGLRNGTTGFPDPVCHQGAAPESHRCASLGLTAPHPGGARDHKGEDVVRAETLGTWDNCSDTAAPVRCLQASQAGTVVGIVCPRVPQGGLKRAKPREAAEKGSAAAAADAEDS